MVLVSPRPLPSAAHTLSRAPSNAPFPAPFPHLFPRPSRVLFHPTRPACAFLPFTHLPTLLLLLLCCLSGRYTVPYPTSSPPTCPHLCRPDQQAHPPAHTLTPVPPMPPTVSPACPHLHTRPGHQQTHPPAHNLHICADQVINKLIRQNDTLAVLSKPERTEGEDEAAFMSRIQMERVLSLHVNYAPDA
eukprot:356245-Chlamydomonas_euryale.AAC.6